MAAEQAATVALISRYLSGLLDPTVSLLEVHKLMYFMQEAGEPLRLNYQKAPYGPYAENLRHVLRAIEGHLVSGYADGGDAPDKQLKLVPSAVEGLESPFGLELLSSVHWVMSNEAVNTVEDVVQHTYAWNERKRQFTPRQIALAVEVLSSKSWVTHRLQ
ncbi:MAG: hypothetical protein WDZ76_12090 [Pseudohongiellaceae bacterium]